jgi:translocator assembly and maintenance protein 41
MRSQTIKYGVISVSRLVDDLRNWSSLYISGRMQKPIRLIKRHSEVDLAQQENMKSALLVGMLLAPEKMSEHDLFVHIAELSFAGKAVNFVY